MRRLEINTIFLVLWTAYIVLSPLYIFASGLPQPADILVIIPAFLACVSYLIQYKGKISPLWAVLCLFVLLVIGINGVYFIALTDTHFVKSSLYYVFNVVVLGFGVLLFKEQKTEMVSWTRWAVMAALLFELILALIIDIDGASGYWRERGSFNNPNQLGYWAFLMACMAVLCAVYRDKIGLVDCLAVIIAFILVCLSLSKAAMVTMFLLIPAYFLLRPKAGLSRIFVGLSAIAICLILMLTPLSGWLYDHAPIVKSSGDRLMTIGLEADDTLAARGYDRLIEYPAYLVFGAGEGAFWRFSENEGYGQELHGALPTILFSYGVMGFVLFMTAILMIVWRQPALIWAILALTLLYGLAHHSIRFTGFWVLLAFIAGGRNIRRPKEEETTDG